LNTKDAAILLGFIPARTPIFMTRSLLKGAPASKSNVCITCFLTKFLHPSQMLLSDWTWSVQCLQRARQELSAVTRAFKTYSRRSTAKSWL